MAGIVLAHRSWLAGAAVAVIAAGELIPATHRAPRAFRRARTAVARGIGRRPWITATVLFLLVVTATALPWSRGVEYLGVRPWHDCESNLLQARLLLSGRLAGPPLEHPEFFAVPHVLVEPVYCSKYPPGYAAVMALGLVAGRVELVPPILVGLAVAAAWLLGRRIVGRLPALLAALALATCPMVANLGLGHLSSTLALLLGVLAAGWWGGRDEPSWGRAVRVGGVLGFCLLVRTFDAVILGVFLGSLLLFRGMRRRRVVWRPLLGLALGVVPGLFCLLAYHHATMGHALRSPYVCYEQTYNYRGQFLFESVEPPPNLEDLPINLRRVAEEEMAPVHREHTVARLPLTALSRLERLTHRLGAAWLLLPLAFLAPRRSRWLVGCVLVFFAGYLLYAFGNPRYMAAVLPAAGWAMAAGVGRARRYLLEGLLVVLLIVSGVAQVDLLQRKKVDVATWRFREAVKKLPEGRRLVFLRYAPLHSVHREWAYNEADLDEAETVFAHDRGDQENAKLCEAYPERAAYLYGEGTPRARTYVPRRR